MYEREKYAVQKDLSEREIEWQTAMEKNIDNDSSAVCARNVNVLSFSFHEKDNSLLCLNDECEQARYKVD